MSTWSGPDLRDQLRIVESRHVAPPIDHALDLPCQRIGPSTRGVHHVLRLRPVPVLQHRPHEVRHRVIHQVRRHDPDPDLPLRVAHVRKRAGFHRRAARRRRYHLSVVPVRPLDLLRAPEPRGTRVVQRHAPVRQDPQVPRMVLRRLAQDPRALLRPPRHRHHVAVVRPRLRVLRLQLDGRGVFLLRAIQILQLQETGRQQGVRLCHVRVDLDGLVERLHRPLHLPRNRQRLAVQMVQVRSARWGGRGNRTLHLRQPLRIRPVESSMIASIRLASTCRGSCFKTCCSAGIARSTRPPCACAVADFTASSRLATPRPPKARVYPAAPPHHSLHIPLTASPNLFEYARPIARRRPAHPLPQRSTQLRPPRRSPGEPGRKLHVLILARRHAIAQPNILQDAHANPPRVHLPRQRHHRHPIHSASNVVVVPA
jgi:hypothetical protein